MDLNLMIYYDKSSIGIFEYISNRESEKVVEVKRSDRKDEKHNFSNKLMD